MVSTGVSKADLDSTLKDESLEEIKQKCREVAVTDPGDTQKIASVLTEMSLHYYDDVRKQAERSFSAALTAAAVGTMFFLAAAVLVMNNRTDKATISLISGSLIQVISGINFYLYGKAGRQFSLFHVCLERMNRFLVANSICENLTCPHKRDEIRADLVRMVGQAPMLSVDGGNHRSGGTGKAPGAKHVTTKAASLTAKGATA